jgi:SAM-dependent methyltransferase
MNSTIWQEEDLVTNRLYTDLAWLWPLWGDHTTEYARYCEHVVRLIEKHTEHPVKSLLDISCGGGKNVYNLKHHFTVTGLDVSRAMIKLAIELNPECEFAEGDMRNFSLGQSFDAILMDDGISHMTGRADLAAALRCAGQHLKTGGVMVLTLDVTSETFIQNQTTCSQAVRRLTPEGLDIAFVENIYDTDPADEQFEASMIYLIRENGRLRIESDRFTLGLFSLDTWRQLLSDATFEIHQATFVDGDNEYISFACIKR